MIQNIFTIQRLFTESSLFDEINLTLFYSCNEDHLGGDREFKTIRSWTKFNAKCLHRRSGYYEIY